MAHPESLIIRPCQLPSQKEAWFRNIDVLQWTSNQVIRLTLDTKKKIGTIFLKSETIPATALFIISQYRRVNGHKYDEYNINGCNLNSLL